MSVVYIPHICIPGGSVLQFRHRSVPKYPKGSIFRCDDCGTYWHLVDRWTGFGYQLEWSPVRWWNFRSRRTIRVGVLPTGEQP